MVLSTLFTNFTITAYNVYESKLKTWYIGNWILKWKYCQHGVNGAVCTICHFQHWWPSQEFSIFSRPNISQRFAKYLQHICLRSKLLQHLFGESQRFCGQFRSMSRPKRTTQCKKFLSGPSTCSLYYSIFVFKIVFTFLCEWGWVVKKVVWRELKPRRMLRGVSPHSLLTKIDDDNDRGHDIS